jgi:hypothetical protein
MERAVRPVFSRSVKCADSHRFQSHRLPYKKMLTNIKLMFYLSQAMLKCSRPIGDPKPVERIVKVRQRKSFVMHPPQHSGTGVEVSGHFFGRGGGCGTSVGLCYFGEKSLKREKDEKKEKIEV